MQTLRRIFLTGLFALLLTGTALCQKPKLRYGAEWGIMESVLQGTHAIFTTEEGFPVKISHLGSKPHPNMFILANVGMELEDIFSLSLYSGYMGVAPDKRIFPITGRVGVTPFGARSDGPVAYLDAGIGIVDRKADYILVLAKGGGGYRYALSRNSSVDLLLNLQMAFDQPEVWDRVTESYIPEYRVRASKGFYLAVGLSVALNF